MLMIETIVYNSEKQNFLNPKFPFYDDKRKLSLDALAPSKLITITGYWILC